MDEAIEETINGLSRMNDALTESIMKTYESTGLFEPGELAQNQTRQALSMSQEGLGTIRKAIGFRWTVHVKASSYLVSKSKMCNYK